jgi:hypothetical protein
MNEFLENNGTKNIAGFDGAGQLISALFAHHTISVHCLDDDEMIAEAMEIRKTGTWNDLNEWIENNF